MRMRFRTRQAALQLLVSCTQLKFVCQAALLPSVLLGGRLIQLLSMIRSDQNVFYLKLLLDISE
jgi:hypothetical protein